MGYIALVVFCGVALMCGLILGVYVSNEYQIQSVSELFTKISEMATGPESSDQNKTQTSLQNLTQR